MSIFTKVLILFLVSLTLMLFVSNKSNRLTKETIESLLKERYIQASDELFGYLANNDMEKLNQKIDTLGFTVLNKMPSKMLKVLYEHSSELSEIRIFKTADEKYLLFMRYLDDSVLLSDNTQDKYLQELTKLHSFIIADIFILVALFALILTILYPLRKITQKIKNFGEGNYTTRIETTNSDEIGELSKSFNAMASNIAALIESRERLLRDIAHELKTPLSKSKFALEMIEESKYKQMLDRANQQMEMMIDELLHIEKLQANKYYLKIECFNSTTLTTEALSKLFIENESDIVLEVKNNFEIEADLFYLSIALKNLIDNALKYTQKKPIHIIIQNNTISIVSRGKKLNNSLEYYCEAFTQEDSSRNAQGYGLGLSLVKSILQKHHFQLIYTYKDNKNNFSIHFNKE